MLTEEAEMMLGMTLDVYVPRKLAVWVVSLTRGVWNSSYECLSSLTGH